MPTKRKTKKIRFSYLAEPIRGFVGKNPHCELCDIAQFVSDFPTLRGGNPCKRRLLPSEAELFHLVVRAGVKVVDMGRGNNRYYLEGEKYAQQINGANVSLAEPIHI